MMNRLLNSVCGVAFILLTVGCASQLSVVNDQLSAVRNQLSKVGTILTVNDYEDAVEALSSGINRFLLQEIESKRLPLVMDVYVEAFPENKTLNRIEFGEQLRNDLTRKLDENRKKIKTDNTDDKADIVYYLSEEQSQHKPFVIIGDFHEVDDHLAQINVAVVETAAQKVIHTYEVTFHIKSIQPDHFKEFASQVRIRFLEYKKQFEKVAFHEIDPLLEESWDRLFTREQAKEMGELIGLKAEKSLKRVDDYVDSAEELEKRLEIVEELSKPVFYFEKIAFEYSFKDDVNDRLMKTKRSLLDLKKVLKSGINTTVSFVAHAVNNTPLGFQCSGIIHNKTIDLTIVNKNFPAKAGNCSTKKEEQLMTWYRTYRLKSSESIPVWATERNVLSRDITINGHIVVKPEDLLQIYQKGSKQFEIQGTEYSVLFYKK